MIIEEGGELSGEIVKLDAGAVAAVPAGSNGGFPSAPAAAKPLA